MMDGIKREELIAISGVNLMFMPEYFIAESKTGMLSPDGYSKTYDKSANYFYGDNTTFVC